MRRRTSGSSSSRSGGHQQGLGQRASPFGSQGVEPDHGRVVEDVAGGVVAGGLRGDRHRIDEGHSLAPVVVGSRLADHGEDGVGITRFVGGRPREPFDLPDHVVAQVADDAAVQRREGLHGRRSIGAEKRFDRGQDPPLQGDANREVALHRDPPVACNQRRGRAPPHERPAPPPLGVLHRLEKEGAIGRVGPGQTGKGGDGRGQVGEKLPPDRDDGVAAGQRRKVLTARMTHGARGSSGPGSEPDPATGPNGR